jgi:hypothetical protein
MIISNRGRHGRDRMVVEFTTTYLQSVPITTNVVSSIPAQVWWTRYNIMWYSLSVTFGRSMVSSTNKTDHHGITDIMLKGPLNSLTLTLNFKHTYLINVILSSCQYQHWCISILTVAPEIKCGNFSAVSGDKFVDMICYIELKGISCKDDILWENGNTGEQYKIDTSHKGYQVFCEVCIKWLACSPRVR